MSVPESGQDEEARLQALYSYEVLDTMAEQSFDDICRFASLICGTPISLITLLDRNRQWFKAAVGLDVRETPREHSFCTHALLEDDMLVVEDAHDDERFLHSPLVLAKPQVRFYAGQPLRSTGGHALGTLCVIDTVPRKLSDDQKEAVRRLARQVEIQLELRRMNAELIRLDRARERLLQFAAHDAASPLMAIQMLASELAQIAPAEQEHILTISRELQASADSVANLAADLRDIGVERASRLAPRWQKVSVEVLMDMARAVASPRLRKAGLELAAHVTPDLEVDGDPDLLRRLLQNLLFNAIDHTPRGGTVSVRLASGGDGHTWIMHVEDEGPGIPENQRDRIFDMYASATDGAARGEVSRGIGLAFCRAATVAHAGRIEVTSREPRGCSFKVMLPRRRPAPPTCLM